MVLRTAGRGRYEGQQFWGCATYPKCRAVVGIRGHDVAATVGEAFQEDAPGAFARARYEPGRQEHAARIRRRWPFLVGLTIILMAGIYLVALAAFGPIWGGQ